MRTLNVTPYRLLVKSSIALLLVGLELLYLSGCGVPSHNFNSTQLEKLNNSAEKFALARQQMVDRQLRARGIKNKAVLAAMSQIPRHRFVDPSVAHLAYADSPLPIGHDQTISQPYIVAYMSEVAEITSDEKVLEIGTGSGYQAAVLSQLAKEVYSIEILPQLAKKAHQTLNELGYDNISLKTGDGYAGWAEFAPYDAIIVTAAPDHIPEPLVEQLKENGKMVIPVGTRYQEMIVLTKTADRLLEKRTIPVRFVPMRRKPSTTANGE